MCDEHPEYHTRTSTSTEWGMNGVIEDGMVLCVESYIGELGGREGVKLEQQVSITRMAAASSLSYPLEARLL